MARLTKRACLTKPACQEALLPLDCQEALMPLVCQAPLVPLVPQAPLVVLVPPEGLLDPLALLDLAGREFLAVGLPPEWV